MTEKKPYKKPFLAGIVWLVVGGLVGAILGILIGWEAKKVIFLVVLGAGLGWFGTFLGAGKGNSADRIVTGHQAPDKARKWLDDFLVEQQSDKDT